MARFRLNGDEWDREDVERWELIRQLPTALRTALEVPTPQLTMNELLNKADDLFATLDRDAATSVDTDISAAVFAGTRVKRRVVNNQSDKHNAVKSKQLCWYHRKFGDKSRFCNGPPYPDITRAYLKVEQRSRETQRAIVIGIVTGLPEETKKRQ